MSNDPLVTANALFVEENYEEAAKFYDQAITKAPSAAAYLARAQNSIKLKNYIDAIGAADTAIRLDPNNSNAHLRKGVALFHTGEFASAKAAFQCAAQLGNTQTAMWLRKCDTELSLEDGSSVQIGKFTVPKPTGDAVVHGSCAPYFDDSAADEHDRFIEHVTEKTAEFVSIGKFRVPRSAEGDFVATSSVLSAPATPDIVTMGASGAHETKRPAPAPLVTAPMEAAPLASHVRHSHYQSATQVFLTLFAKHLKPDNVDIKFEDHRLTVKLRLPDSSVYSREWTLFAPIVPSQCTHDITLFKVEIALRVISYLLPASHVLVQKQRANFDWDALEEQQMSTVKRANLVDSTVKATSYPTSSAKGRTVDWDELNQQQKKDEEEEPATGDAGLNKLFQKIYADGDEATRRAMIKSYQTSGGTVLSTNWKEVAERDYEKDLTAPKGQDVKKRDD